MSRGGRAPGLYELLSASTVVVGSLVGLALAAQVAISREVASRTSDAEEAAAAVATAAAIDRNLREEARLRELQRVDPDPALPAIVADLATDVRRVVGQLDHAVSRPEEHALLARIEGGLAAPAERRDGATGLDRALVATADLRSFNERELTDAHREVARLLLVERGVALATLVALGGCLVVLLAGSRALVVQPVLDLRAAIDRFWSGDLTSRARPAGARDLAELSGAFNFLAESLEHQRQDQLAYLGGVAHDLRDPIAALKVGHELLARAPQLASTSHLARLSGQIDRLARMVGDLLDATRVEAGRLELRPADVDLCEVAQAMIDRHAATHPDHTITLSAPQGPIHLQADGLRLEQVVGNLVSNAIKYSPDGGPVEVAVTRTDTEAVVTVVDHGIGIEDEDLPRIFAPFRPRKGGAEGIPGAGLGLSVVRRIVLAHGGRIEVRSTPGFGSTFRVFLPLATSGAPAHDEEPTGHETGVLPSGAG